MKVKEFRLLVHGPFATNIFLDLWNLAELRALSLDQKEIEILEYMKRSPKTKRQIFERCKISEEPNSDVPSPLKNLTNQNFVVSQDRNRIGTGFEKIWNKITLSNRSTEDKKFSVSSDGLLQLKAIKKFKKLKKDGSFDKSLVTNFLDKEKQNFEGRKPPLMVEESKNSYKEISSYFFRNEIQAFVLAKFSMEDFHSVDTQGVRLEFKKNTIHVLASGVGIFSTQIIVSYPNEVDITAINRKDLERKVSAQLEELFPAKIKQHIDLLKVKAEENFETVDLFKFEDKKVAKLAWIHIIYWFYNDEFFEVEDGGIRNLKRELLRHFTFILEQKLDDPLDLQDRYVFYGLNKSLVLTRNYSDHNLELVTKIGSLIEIGQYFCFGLNLLEFFLSRSISRLMVEQPMTEQSSRNIKVRIEDIETIRSTSRRYLEQYRSGIKTIIHQGEISLVDKLENAWRLQSLQDGILLKLDSLEKELSSREQALLSHKQDRFSNIAFIFTVISLASVMGSMIALSPLKELLELNPNFPLSRPLFFVLFSTALVIIGTVYFVWKSYGLRQKLLHRGEEVARKAHLGKAIKKSAKSKVLVPQDFS